MTSRHSVPVFVMEVTVQSVLENEAQGRVKISCDPADTIDSLISAFCIEKGVRQKKEYVLRNINNDILHNTRKIVTCGLQDGDILYLGNEVPGSTTFGCSNWWLLAMVSLLIGSVGIVAISILKVTSEDSPVGYGIIIDCGSTHTEVFVYEWPGGKLNGTGVVDQAASCRVEDPLASFEDHPAEAGPSISDCIQKAAVDLIPKHLQQDTPIYLGATAGMRMLDEKNPNASADILKSVRKTLASFPFMFDVPEVQARIISGVEEGLFSWVTVNYLFGVFKSSSSSTSGALDLGGASTEITFQTDQKFPQNFSETARLYGDSYEVYADSFLCYGKSEIYRRFLANLVSAKKIYNDTTVVNPCAPQGSLVNESYSEVFEAPCTTGRHAVEAFGSKVVLSKDIPKNATFHFQGASNLTQCQLEIDKLFDFKCPTSYAGHCSFNGHYIPPLSGNYVAFTGFYFVADFLNLTSSKGAKNTSLTAFEKASDTLCAKSWDEVKHMPAPNPEFLPEFCFDSLYILALLTKGYHFNHTTWTSINFTNEIKGTTIGWPVGYMLNITNIIPPELPIEKISVPVFAGLMVVFILFILVAIGFACQAKRLRVESNPKYEKIPAYGSV